MVDQSLPEWKIAFRVGLAPCIGLRGLIALRNAAASNSQRLIQHHTVQPPTSAKREALQCCAISYPGWECYLQDKSSRSVYEYFKATCELANIELEDTEGCEDVSANDFVAWYDCTPREKALAELTEELDYIIEKMKKGESLV